MPWVENPIDSPRQDHDMKVHFSLPLPGIPTFQGPPVYHTREPRDTTSRLSLQM